MLSDRAVLLQGLVFAEVSATAYNIRYSGNLARHITLLGNGKIRVSAPAYRVVGKYTKGIKKGMPKIKLTHGKIGKTNFTHYAYLLNVYGSWGRGLKNVGWCNDAILRACFAMQSLMGGASKCVIINKLK